MIIISNYYVVETLGRLEEVGIDLSKVFFSNEILIEPIEEKYIQGKRKELLEAYNFLEDYESKAIFKSMVESRFTNNIDLLSRTCRDSQYFPIDVFRFREDEVFVDGGAFDGDSINNFLQLTQGKFKYIYAFEPDAYNYMKLEACHQDDKIKLFNMGLFEKDMNISFMSRKGGSSQIKTNGEDIIKVCCFDKLDVPDKRVTFIKMDIEGSELSALRGMEETICKYKPKLAICLYHKFEDLWEIPLFIKMLVPEYKLYIRNHTTYLDEIVLYATV